MVLADRRAVDDSSRVRALSLIVAADDDLCRARLRAILLALDARVREGTDIWDVMSSLLCAGDPVDLVIMDLRILPLSGLEALGLARAAGIEVPFLFITSASSLAIHAAAARLGAAIIDRALVPGGLVAHVQDLCGAPGDAACPGPGAA